MPPLGYTVGFIHGDRMHIAPLEQPHEILRDGAFRRNEHELDFSRADTIRDNPFFIRIQRTIDSYCRDPELAQPVDLVFHQCDQRRDNDRDPTPKHRGGLIAQRFSATSRHHHQRIPARDDGGDRVLLGHPKGVEPPFFFQHPEELVRNPTLAVRR